MDIGNVVRRFRSIPVFDPFRRVPEVVPERADEEFEEAVLAAEAAEPEVA
jgi:hypothetical protein